LQRGRHRPHLRGNTCWFGGAQQEWFVYGKDAWDVRGNPPRADFSLWEPFSQSDMGAWRNLEIWLTPPGFIKAAKANRATVRRRGAGSVVSFKTADGLTLTGYLNAQHLVERITGGRVFDSNVFMLTALPDRVDWGDVTRVVVLGLVLSLLATLYPSWRAARTDPVVALRNE